MASLIAGSSADVAHAGSGRRPMCGPDVKRKLAPGRYQGTFKGALAGQGAPGVVDAKYSGTFVLVVDSQGKGSIDSGTFSMSLDVKGSSFPWQMASTAGGSLVDTAKSGGELAAAQARFKVSATREALGHVKQTSLDRTTRLGFVIGGVDCETGGGSGGMSADTLGSVMAEFKGMGLDLKPSSGSWSVEAPDSVKAALEQRKQEAISRVNAIPGTTVDDLNKGFVAVLAWAMGLPEAGCVAPVAWGAWSKRIEARVRELEKDVKERSKRGRQATLQQDLQAVEKAVAEILMADRSLDYGACGRVDEATKVAVAGALASFVPKLNRALDFVEAVRVDRDAMMLGCSSQLDDILAAAQSAGARAFKALKQAGKQGADPAKLHGLAQEAMAVQAAARQVLPGYSSGVDQYCASNPSQC